MHGPQVMRGYWNKPEETAKVLTADGWLRTGDMGFMDERGFVKLVDRKKDMIVVSGFKVYPNEVEDVVMMHPGVLEVAAVGVPDERSGEAVEDRRGEEGSGAHRSRTHRALQEAPHRVQGPAQVEFRSEPLPKTNVGKILRRVIRDEEAGKAAGSQRAAA